VLVLGLDGSGKSTFLRVLSGKPPLEGHIPTWGFNSVRLPTKDFEVDLLESEHRPHLPSYLPVATAGAMLGFFGGKGGAQNAHLSITLPCLKPSPLCTRSSPSSSLAVRAFCDQGLQIGHPRLY
jgi:hypothetical protein